MFSQILLRCVMAACDIGGPSTTDSWPPSHRRRQRKHPPVRCLSFLQLLPPPPLPLRLLLLPRRHRRLRRRPPRTVGRRGGQRPGLPPARESAVKTPSDKEQAARAPCLTIDVATIIRVSCRSFFFLIVSVSYTFLLKKKYCRRSRGLCGKIM